MTKRFDEYLTAEVQRLLAEHLGISEQGIMVVLRDHTLMLFGEVESAQRRDHIVRVLKEQFPEITVRSDIGLTRKAPPTEAEELR